MKYLALVLIVITILVPLVGLAVILILIALNVFKDSKDNLEHSERVKDSLDPAVTYKHYIKSEAWRAKRLQRLIIDNYQCQQCGTSENLQVHHITYNSLGYEKMEHLVTLCEYHHKELHDEEDRNRSKHRTSKTTRPSLWLP